MRDYLHAGFFDEFFEVLAKLANHAQQGHGGGNSSLYFRAAAQCALNLGVWVSKLARSRFGKREAVVPFARAISVGSP
jgi:hypothetical protein